MLGSPTRRLLGKLSVTSTSAWSTLRECCLATCQPASCSVRKKVTGTALAPKHQALLLRPSTRDVRGLTTSAAVLRQIMLPDSTFQSPVPDIHIPRDVTIHDHFFSVCDKFSERTAMTEVAGGKSYTYAQLKVKVKQVASGLHLAGFRKDDVIMVFSGNQLDFTVLFLACSCLGLWLSPANPQFTAGELNRQMSHSGAVSIFSSEALVDITDQALAMTDLPHRITSKYVLGQSPGFLPFETLMAGGSAYPDVGIDPFSDILTLPYSSGTTGLPKGVMLTHYNCLANVLQIEATMPMSMSDQRALCLLPLYHIYGMTCVQFGVLNGGGHLFYMSKFEPHSFLQCIQDNKITFAHLVPPLVVFLAKNAAVSSYDLRSLRHIYSGAAPLGQDVTEACLKRLPDIESLNQVYGMTETSPVMTLDSKEIQGSIGPLVANTVGKVADIDNSKPLPAGEVGELCVKGPQVMKGYYNNQKATDDTIDDEGWLHTGDIVYVDSSTGAVYMKDRMKELIKYKGSQVAPAELEDLLIGHPGIQDAAVVGVPDEMAGELPKAFVVKKPDFEVSGEEIQIFVEERVAHTKRLRGGVQFVDEIPKNPSGKILRRVIKAKYL